MAKQNKQSLKTNHRNLILLIVGIIMFAGFAMASTYVINSNGISVDGNKSFARTADVVVCRGTSALDDIVKSFQCDVVCKSTDLDCHDNIEAAALKCKNDGGGTVLLKEGTYELNITNINLTILEIDSCNLAGSSMDSVIIKAVGRLESGGAYLVNVDASGNYGSKVSDLTIDMNADNLIYGSYTGQKNFLGLGFISNAQYSKVENVVIKNGNIIDNAATSSIYGIGLDPNSDPYSSFENLFLYNIDYPLWVTRTYSTTPTYHTYDKIFIENGLQAGIFIEAGNGNTYSNIITKNTSSSIRIAIGNPSESWNMVFNNLIIEDAHGYGIFASSDGSPKDIIFNNFIIDNVQRKGTVDHGIYLESTTTGFKFNNGIIKNANGTGLVVRGKDHEFNNIDVFNNKNGISVETVSYNSEFTNVKSYNNSQIGFNIQNYTRCIDCQSYNNNRINQSSNKAGFRLINLEPEAAKGNPTYLINPVCYDNTGTNQQVGCFELRSNYSVVATNIMSNHTSMLYNSNGYDGYFENYQYTKIPVDGRYIFKDRTIHNATAICTNMVDAWKCLYPV